MGDPTTNHYEQQLYSMFKSFDVNNEESLDENAVNKLCDALQLEERGAALVDTLFERRAGRVSFAQFRSGLLAVLGDPRAPDAAADAAPDPAPDAAPPPAAADDLEPRFVLGSKKYGRRSRPPHAAAADEPRAASASRLDADERRPRYRRSASAVERRDDEPALEHDRLIGRQDALALCRSLRMHSIDRRLVERIFDDSPAPETTVGEFFHRLNSSLAGAMEDEAEPERAEAALAVERVAEAWEGAGVRRPRRLLADLGFVAATARAADLERALDDELRAFEEPPEGRAALLAAALALARMRVADAERRRDTAAAERDKLRGDVAAADERAGLLAREVDESHARIENELKANLKRAEARHAEDARRAAADVAAERERAASELARLQAEAGRAREAEARLRGAAAEQRARLEEMEARALGAEERGAAAEREAARLAARLREAEAAAAGAAAAAAAAAAGAARAEELARDNQRLRDRADELAAALDRAPAAAPPAPPPPAPPGGALSAELGSLLLDDVMEHAGATLPATGDAGATPPETGDAGATPLPFEDGGATDRDAERDDEKQKLIELVKELEASLEAMRAEYDACEEYWSGKLGEERAAHEAEARAAAERLADLLRRIQDFERRLAPAPPALAAIPEQRQLEQQVEHVEAEFARHRRAAAARLRALAERLARAERRRAPAPAPDLAARCARAEAAVRRLHARLAAADVLVKELYVENCQLAHARPLPL